MHLSVPMFQKLRYKLKHQKIELQRLNKYIKAKKYESFGNKFLIRHMEVVDMFHTLKRFTTSDPWNMGMYFGMKFARDFMVSYGADASQIEKLNYEIGWRFEGRSK